MVNVRGVVALVSSKSAPPCMASDAIQKPHGIGHNGAPSSIKEGAKPALFGINADWLSFADAVDLAKLVSLHFRIERKRRGLADLLDERQVVARRCAKRMRRAAGKS